jgi:alpha-mannosidase
MKKYILLLLLGLSLNSNAQTGIKKDPGSQKNSVTDIIVVFKMHFDIGYTQWAEGVLQQYSGTMLRKTLQSIEETSDLPENEKFIWTVPSWPLKYMLENCDADLKPRLEKAIKEQRIIPHALPITYETEASDVENLARGLSYASEINRKYNLPLPRDAKLTDVPSHSHVIPTLLKNAGVDILHIGCNPGSPSPDVPTLFWWEGTDGSRLLTFNWAEYYGSGILPPADWKHKTWLAMIHTHENTGAPTPAEVADLLAAAKKELPGVRIKIGRLSDFHDLLLKENPELPVIKGDMPDTWIHGYMSNPRETRLSKKLQRETFDTEVLNNLLKTWTGSGESIEKHIDKAVENMILYDEHTFGIALTHGNQQNWSYDDDFIINKSLGYYSYAEASWKEKSNRINTAERIVFPIMNRQLKQLASSVGVEGKRIIVFNSLPWERTGWVKFFGGIYQKNFQIFGIKDALTGEIIPVHNDNNLISFEARNIPAMGYKTYAPVTEPISSDFKSSCTIDEAGKIIENSFFKVVINPQTGAVSSLYDKKNQKELVDKSAVEGFGQYIYEQFGQEQIDEYNKAYVKPGSESWAYQEMGRPAVPLKNMQIMTGICDKIIFRNMGNSVSATVLCRTSDQVQQHYNVTYTLYDNQQYVEVNWGIDGKKPMAAPEGGWLAFPFALKSPQYRLLRTGGITDPQKDFIKRSNHDFYFLNTSMTMFDKSGSGVVLNCPDAPGISIESRGLYKFSGEKNLSDATVYANLYNTQWGTNFTEWIEGSFSSRFFIWSYNKYDAEQTFVTPSEETRTPLYAAYFDGSKGNIPASQKGLSLSRKGILVTAYCKNRDGEGTILRLWEHSGKDGLCKITLPGGTDFKEALACDLRGEIIENQRYFIKGKEIEILVKANQPLTLILK